MNPRFHTFITFTLVFIISAINSFAQNQENLTLVQAIAEQDYAEIQVMLGSGANINMQNDLGWTPLHAAVIFGKKDVIRLLLDNQADLNIKDNSGKTPLFLAVESGQREIVDILLAMKPDLNIVNNNGDNALSLAQKVGLFTIANTLRENGASIPGQGIPNQGMPQNNGRGMPPGQGNSQFNNMFGQRRGQRGININSDVEDKQINPNMPDSELTMNSNTNFVQNVDAAMKDKLDPNEVQERIKKYPGLTEAVADIAGGNKSALNQWRKTDIDNRVNLISAIRRQYDKEVEFIQKIAKEEKANKTLEQAENLEDSRKGAFIDINNEVKNDQSQNRLTSSTTSSRRSGRTTGTMTRTTRRGSNMTTQQTNITQEQENQYPPEVQSEIDIWLKSDITNLNGRMSLMESVNDTIVSEIKSLRQTAESEKAEKTVASIDGLLLAKQMIFDELQKEFQKIQQEQGIQNITNMPDMQNMPDFQGQDMMPGMPGRGNRGQDMMQGRGMRGR